MITRSLLIVFVVVTATLPHLLLIFRYAGFPAPPDIFPRVSETAPDAVTWENSADPVIVVVPAIYVFTSELFASYSAFILDSVDE